ncbi:LptF/LptG family permease [Pseudochryseolinea flava]|uniref:Permease n=1 Tax=Pseudochryseolinea flava TaxID=2059302 RepID=A0A364XZR1_9BACT|nr:LptF/LptG family permease [Pseudochryseolinea flava]RAV99820.1 permease [Pseudochryseolinea flava]
MKLIDKYILRQFLSTFFFVVLILLAVITVIDLTEKMDKFAKANVSSAQIASYYLDFVIWIASLLTPITIFIATVYVCARMAGRTEIIAILSSGVSFRRYLFPFFIGSILVAGISFALNGWVIPNSNKTRLAFEVQYLKSKYYFDKKNIHIQVSPNVYLYMQSYNNSNMTGYHFTMEKFENNKLIEKLVANRIQWDSVKQKWKMKEWQIKRIENIFHPTKDGQDSVRATDLIGTEDRDTALVIHPKEFESDYRKYDGMTIGELKHYIGTLKARGSTGVEAYEVELYTRYAAPFTIFILVFMGAIVSSRKSRGGTGVQIALGFLLSFVLIIFVTVFRTYAENGSELLTPALSVWIPNIIFGSLALVMYKYVPR